MIIKKIAKGLLVFFLVFAVGFILHTSVFGRLVIGVVTPNILLMLTSAFGFMNGGIWGMGFGFISGLMVDSFNADYFGLNCLLFLFIGFLNGLMTKFFYGDDIRLPVLLIGLSDVIYGVIIYLFMFMLGKRDDFTFYFMNIIMPEAVYTLLVFIVLYFPLLRSFQWIKNTGARTFLQ